MPADFIIQWDEIEPEVAAKNGLCCDGESPIRGPVNELGEECPWPWEPQQLGGAPMGQYHCGYCGGMQLAGVPHFDLSLATPEEPAEFPHPRFEEVLYVDAG